MPSTPDRRASGSILVPVDLNPDLKAALEHAVILKKLFGHPVVLVKSDDTTVNINGNIDDAIVVKKTFETWLSGDAAGAAYVVITKGAAPSPDKKTTGRIHKLIRTSPVPVLAIGSAPERNAYENILMPLDLTLESTQKVSKAITFSEADRDVRIHVISVLFSVDDFVINKLTKQIEEVRASLEEKGVACSAELIKTDETEKMGDVVADMVSRSGIDLVIIMSEVETDNRGTRLHENVISIIQRSPAPVMTINPSATSSGSRKPS